MPAPRHRLPLPAALTARRRQRRWAALALVGAVLWLHGWLIGGLAPGPAGRLGAAQPMAALQVRTLQRPAVADLSAAAALPAPAAAPPPDRAALLGERAATAAAPAQAVQAGAARVPLQPTGAEGSAPVPVPSTAATAGTATAGATDTADAPPAEPPPVYPTRVPAPVLLRYALRYNGQAGEATLAWRHDDQTYSLQLDGRSAQRPLVEQASRGGFDAAGLAPERFTDRRRGARWQAANFRRDIGRIGFSGPEIDYPAWPGAQDRLSWLAQLVAIRAAAVPAAPGAAAVPEADISLFVVDARGAGGLWRFADQGEVLLASPLGPQAAQLWRREPPRPEGLRVEAWLDAGRQHWPLQLRFTALRSGDVFELLLLAEPALPP